MRRSEAEEWEQSKLTVVAASQKLKRMRCWVCCTLAEWAVIPALQFMYKRMSGACLQADPAQQ